jgi:uncharacterized protein YbcI
MSDGEAQTTENRPRLAGGQLLAAISNSIVAILREHYGRGPMKAKTDALDDIIVVVMRGSGFTALEQTIMDSGAPERVVDMRHDFQRVMAKRYTETIEALTGAKCSRSSAKPTSSPTSRWRSSLSTNRSRASAPSRSSNLNSAGYHAALAGTLGARFRMPGGRLVLRA